MACCWNIQSELKFDGPNPWSPCYSKYRIKTECKRSIDMSKEALWNCIYLLSFLW